MAYAIASVPPGVTPPFDNLVSQNLVGQAVFSTFLSSNRNDTNSSALILGGIDSSYYNGTWSYASFNILQPLLGYWLIAGTDILVNGKSLDLCWYCSLIVDTGTSILTGPTADVTTLINAIGTVNPDCSNRETLPVISFVIDGKTLTLEPDFYILYGPDDSGQNSCQLGIEGLDIGLPEFWILGDPWLRKYYTMFDKVNSRVGFAKAVER